MNYTLDHPKYVFWAGKLHLALSLYSLRRGPGVSGFPLEPCLYEPEIVASAVPPMQVAHGRYDLIINLTFHVLDYYHN